MTSMRSGAHPSSRVRLARGVLPAGGPGIALHLGRARLAHVDERQALAVGRRDGRFSHRDSPGLRAEAGPGPGCGPGLAERRCGRIELFEDLRLGGGCLWERQGQLTQRQWQDWHGDRAPPQRHGAVAREHRRCAGPAASRRPERAWPARWARSRAGHPSTRPAHSSGRDWETAGADSALPCASPDPARARSYRRADGTAVR